ncbi:hypothetical protein [Vibrio sp. ER1A]|uniref:hypothetical protein n=1 Tax=Vibrio sp. ER1A TaxID=1517681 RepID=UPI0004DD8F9E|nr:hypothetical protein [Vibrio sp. ER1A]KFA98779.1 hypothetical protein HW45_07075 [Vibrio sp. ER1A]
MALGDLELIAGTTLRFQLKWEAESELGKLEPVQMDGCTAKFAVRDVKTGEIMATADTNDGIDIDVGSSTLTVALAAHKSRHFGEASNGTVDYEVRVSFPSGDVYSLVHAGLDIKRGAIDD